VSKFIGLVLMLVIVNIVMVFEAKAELDPSKPFTASIASTANTGSTGATEAVIKQVTLDLQSIIQQQEVRRAIINGKLVVEGDTIEAYELVAINTNTVVLRSAEKRLRLTLFTDVKTKIKTK
jgi:MSHA biogenesis protein MshK